MMLSIFMIYYLINLFIMDSKTSPRKPKRYDSFKSCLIRTATDEFMQKFSNDWTFSDIRSWMLDTYCIEESSIVELEMSSVTIYKNEKID